MRPFTEETNKPVRKTASQSVDSDLQETCMYSKRCKKLFFEIRTIDCRRNAHQNWPKIIYSLTYSTSQVYTKNAAKTELLNWLSGYGAICTCSCS